VARLQKTVEALCENKKSKSCLSCKSCQKNNLWKSVESVVSSVLPKTNPIFSRQNMHYQYKKRRNGGQKVRQKNETNPFVDNFRCSTAAPGCVSVIPAKLVLAQAGSRNPVAFFLKKKYNLTGF
jgi:hypothetical protein